MRHPICAHMAGRFLSLIPTLNDDECWPWSGPLDRYGYAKFRWSADGRRFYFLGHRLAYELLVGPIPEGLQLDHLCRNRACVNPAHLEPVTQRENIRRGARGLLTVGQDREIRERYKAGESMLAISEALGLARQTVSYRLHLSGLPIRPRGRPRRR